MSADHIWYDNYGVEALAYIYIYIYARALAYIIIVFC